MKKLKMMLALAMSATLFLSGVGFTQNGLAKMEVRADDQYRSELTNEWISTSIQNQRPLAFMVDNEKIALDHYGVNKADIVYEIMNSTANGRITRLMCVVKDWQNLPRIGSIRSARPTNFMLISEYNAVLVHDGGPYYINQYINLPYTDHMSAGFARFSNGKRSEFTEYATNTGYTNPKTGRSYSGTVSRMASAGISTQYNQYHTPGSHFNFSDTEISYAGTPGAVAATRIDLPFPHNDSELRYNAATGTYDYYEYGRAHVDAADNNRVTSFKNVIIMDCSFAQLDAHGYMVYNLICQGWAGYYLTDGYAIPILWSKLSDVSHTTYANATTGQPLVINTGKTYIGIVPSDVWNQVTIQ